MGGGVRDDGGGGGGRLCGTFRGGVRAVGQVAGLIEVWRGGFWWQLVWMGVGLGLEGSPCGERGGSWGV